MNILYFASLKEALGIDNEQIEAIPSMTVGQLKSILNKKYHDNNFSGNILCAVNYTIANDTTKLSDTDEVAFYPPVTGG